MKRIIALAAVVAALAALVGGAWGSKHRLAGMWEGPGLPEAGWTWDESTVATDYTLDAFSTSSLDSPQLADADLNITW